MLDSVKPAEKFESVKQTEKLDSVKTTEKFASLNAAKNSQYESASILQTHSSSLQQNSAQSCSEPENLVQKNSLQHESAQQGSYKSTLTEQSLDKSSSIVLESAPPHYRQQRTENSQKQGANPWQDEDDWGQPRIQDPKLRHLAAEAADNQLTQRKILWVLPLFMLVLMLFSAGFGMMKSAFLVKELQNITDIERIQQLNEQLQYMSGAFIRMQVLGCALWYGLSSLAGSLALVIPAAVYYRICRRNLRSKTAGLAIFDLIKAEVLKYGLLIVMLGCFFKYTELIGSVMMLSFAVLTILEIGLRVWYMPKPNAELQQYLQQTKTNIK